MIRRYVLVLMLLAVPLAAIAGGSSAAGAAVRSVKPVTFKGTIDCTLASGAAITSKPGLQLSTAQEVTITISGKTAKCTGETKYDGSTIVSGALLGSVKGDFSCVSLLSTFPNPKGFITWKTKGKPATKTSVALSAGTFDASTGALSYHSLQKGSFPGHKTVSAVVSASEAQLEAACGSSSGLTKIALSSGAFT